MNMPLSDSANKHVEEIQKGTEITFVCLCTKNRTYQTASDLYMWPGFEEFDSENYSYKLVFQSSQQ